MILSEKRETLTSLWSKKLHYKFIESTEDGDFMLALNTDELLRTSFSDCIEMNIYSARDHNTKIIPKYSVSLVNLSHKEGSQERTLTIFLYVSHCHI